MRAIFRSFIFLVMASSLLLLSACGGAKLEKTLPHQVFFDANLNESLDETDPALQDVLVSLYTEQGEKLEESQTDESGIAFFGAIPENSYFAFQFTDEDAASRALVCEQLDNASLCSIESLADLSKEINPNAFNTQDLANGTYLIKAVHSGQCLDVFGGQTGNGANIIQWPCHGRANQQWQLQAIGGGYYRITAKHSGKIVNIDIGNILKKGNNSVQQWDWLNMANQKWLFRQSGNAFEIVSQHNNSCLDIAWASQQAGADVITWSCHGGTNQKFTVVALETQSTQLIQNGTYTMKARHSGQCLDAFAFGAENGSNVVQWTCNGLLNQQWAFNHLGNNVYTITARHVPKVLDVAGISTANAANVHLWDYLGGNNQKWQARQIGSAFSFSALHSQKCLNVSGYSYAAGASIIQWPCTNGGNDTFSLERVTGTPTTPTTPGQSSAGRWSGVQQWPLIATHMADLTDGRILAWSSYDVDRFGGRPDLRYTQAVIYNPANGSFQEADNPQHDMFCAGLALLPDGRVFAGGGGDGINSSQVSVFNPGTSNWSRLPNMLRGHWYGTAVAMSNGNVYIGYGRDSGNKSEILRGNTWYDLPGINLSGLDAGLETPDWYPYMHLSPSGTIFHSGATATMHDLNVNGTGTTTSKGLRSNDNVYRQWGSAIMIDRGKIMLTGGTPRQGPGSSLASGVIIDINGANPVVTRIANMNYGRSFHTTLLLPNGEVLVVGGNGTGIEFDDAESRLVPEIYNPATNTWRTQPAMSVPRNYHSTGTLLPDGRVLMAGGGLCGSCAANHQDGQIFSPHYLFNSDGSNAARPSITAAPNRVGYNQSFNVSVGGSRSANIRDFYLIKLSANTHAMNTDLRRLKVTVTGQSGSTYTLRTDSNQNVLTPGYYYLFATNDQGVPSVAKTIQVN